MDDAHKLWKKKPKSECWDIWIRLSCHKWLKSWSSKEDPAPILAAWSSKNCNMLQTCVTHQYVFLHRNDVSWYIGVAESPVQSESLRPTNSIKLVWIISRQIENKCVACFWDVVSTVSVRCSVVGWRPVDNYCVSCLQDVMKMKSWPSSEVADAISIIVERLPRLTVNFEFTTRTNWKMIPQHLYCS